eukprot:1145053-Prorocentrum_minimum.AAC.1
MMDQSDAGRVFLGVVAVSPHGQGTGGSEAAATPRKDVWVYSHDGPIGCRTCGTCRYILIWTNHTHHGALRGGQRVQVDARGRPCGVVQVLPPALRKVQGHNLVHPRVGVLVPAVA